MKRLFADLGKKHSHRSRIEVIRVFIGVANLFLDVRLPGTRGAYPEPEGYRLQATSLRNNEDLLYADWIL